MMGGLKVDLNPGGEPDASGADLVAPGQPPGSSNSFEDLGQQQALFLKLLELPHLTSLRSGGKYSPYFDLTLPQPGKVMVELNVQNFPGESGISEFIKVKSAEGHDLPLTLVKSPTASERIRLVADYQGQDPELEISTHIVENKSGVWKNRKVKLFDSLYIDRPSVFYMDDAFIISIPTNFEMDRQSFRDRFSLNPSSDYSIENISKSRIEIKCRLKSNTMYALSFPAGMTSTEGFFSREESRYFVESPEAPPRIKILSRGPYFPHTSQDVIPVSASFGTSISASLVRILPKNFLHYLKSPYDPAFYGNAAANWEWDVPDPKAENQLIKLDISRKAESLEPGIYRLDLALNATSGGKRSYYYGSRIHDHRMIIASDLACHVSRVGDEVSVWVTSLASGKPVSGARVEFYSYQYETLKSVEADSDGLARVSFADDSKKASQVYAVSAILGHDQSITQLNSNHQLPFRSQLPRSYSPFRGLEEKKHFFLYTERNAYRPGDTVHWGAIARIQATSESRLVPASRMEAQWRIQDVSGKRVLASGAQEFDEFGLARNSFDLPSDLPTGNYSLVLFSQSAPNGPSSGSGWESGHPFEVKFFKPDTFQVSKLDSPPNSDISGSAPNPPLIHATQSKFFFGQPVDGFESSLTAYPIGGVTPPDSLSNYNFTPFDPVNNHDRLQLSGVTDSEGISRFSLVPPDSWKKNESFTCQIRNRISNGAGEMHTTYDHAIVFTHPFIFGVTREHAEQESSVTPVTKWNWVAVNPEFAHLPLQEPITWQTSLVKYQRQLVSNHRQEMEWKSRRTFEKLESGTLEPGMASGTIELLDLPRYSNVKLEFFQGQKLISSRQIQSYYRHSHTSGSSSPDRLEINWEGESRSGGSGMLAFDALSDGVALVEWQFMDTVRSEVFPISAGQVKIPCTLPETSTGSVYAMVHFLPDPNHPRSISLPRRFSGITEILVSQPDHQTRIALTVPDLVRPGEDVPFQIQLDVNNVPVSGRIHFFGIDEGVLAKGKPQNIDAFSYFHGNQPLLGNFYDIFDSIFNDPDQVAEFFQKSQIGGGFSGAFQNPYARDLEKLALVSLETLNIPASGRVASSFKAPDLEGRMRLFAVAVTENSVGSLESGLVIRNPVSVHLGGPVVVTPQDSFHLTAVITADPDSDLIRDNPDGLDVNLNLAASRLRIELDNPTSPQPVRLDGPASKRFIIPVTPEPGFLGNASLNLTLDAGTGEAQSYSITVSVRPGMPRQSFSEVITVPSGQSHDAQLKNLYHPGSTRIRMSIEDDQSGMVKNALRWLDSYPYGCLEQTVSGSFPHLYNQVFSQSGEKLNPAMGINKIQMALTKLEYDFWNGSGFTMWPGRNRGNSWDEASLHAAHFIIASEKAGFKVGESFRADLITWIKSLGNPSYLNSDTTHHQFAYAHYLLSLTGESNLLFLKSIARGKELKGFNRLMILGAIAQAGDRNFALEKAGDIKMGDVFDRHEPDESILTNISCAGMSLNILSGIEPELPVVHDIIKYIADKKYKHGAWGTTYNNALVAIGMARYLTHTEKKTPPAGSITLGGKSPTIFDADNPFSQSMSGITQDTNLDLNISNSGTSPISFAIEYSGIPMPGENAPEESNGKASGFLIEKKYYRAGTLLPPRWKLGEIVDIRIQMDSNRDVSDLVIVDLLPGCLQVEDKSGVSSMMFGVKNHDVREDRYLVFGNKRSGSGCYITYRARVVHSGNFAIPSASVEAMYAPDIRGEWTTSSTIVIAD